MPIDDYRAVMPSAEVLPFRPRPSRDFAIRQATLLALHQWYPFTVTQRGLEYVARSTEADILACNQDGETFMWLVCRQFQTIAARYDLRDTPCR